MRGEGARGLDAEALLALVGLEPASRMALPLADRGPLDVSARVELDGARVDVKDIEARARSLHALGGFHWSPWDHAGAVLLDLEVVRAGIAFSRGKPAEVAVDADEAWLAERVPGARSAPAPREDAWVLQGAQP